MKNSASPKRSTAVAAELAPEVKVAACVEIPLAAVDAPMWPVHSAAWLQPEASAAAPSWTSLNIERRNRIPSPDFIRFPLDPFPRAAAIHAVREALFPSARPIILLCDLAPLGWDARAASPKKESQ